MEDSRIEKPEPLKDGFDFPAKVTDVAMAFGGEALSLMPAYKDIPAEFRENSANKWREFQSRWFFSGLKSSELTPRDDIYAADALRHLKLLQTSWGTKHEHKSAAVAWLVSRWFADVNE